jgi:hypothetical protein
VSARRPRLPLALLAVALLAAAIAGISSSGALFTAQRSNPGNDFSSSSYFGFFDSGSYVGDGNDNRSITGVGFRPDVVIVKGDTGQTAVIRTSTMSGDSSKPMAGATGPSADMIQSLNANGFEVGAQSPVNSSGVSYQWMAFRAQDGLLKVGSYSGNGATQSVSGAGFSPEYAAVFSAGAQNAVQRYSGMTTSFQFDGDTGNAQRITSLDGNGFSVGTQNTVNSSGTAYHWIAFNDSAGLLDVGSYAGNGADPRSVTGVGFQPEYVMVRGSSIATPRQGVHRPASLAGDSTLRFDATGNFTNNIQTLQSDGFEVGGDSNVNYSGTTYHYLAARDTAGSSGGGCASPGSASVPASADAFVDQGSPSSNFGTSSDLFVMSKSGNANRRTLVRFNLPAIPGGCSVTGASLTLQSTSAVAGRTIDLYRAGASWTEAGVNWSNAPSTTGTATSRVSATGANVWDATQHVEAMYSGANNGFVLRDSSESSAASPEQKYQAREGSPDSQDPFLTVSWG